MVFVAAVNVISFVTAFDKKQLMNPYYLSERAHAISMLAEHVIFESGFLLKEESYDNIAKYIKKASDEKGIDPLLIYTIISSTKKSAYNIDMDGSIGYMGVKTTIIKDYPGKNPFHAEDNIFIGVSHLASLIEQESDLESAIEQYLAPTKNYHSTPQLAKSIYENYVGLLAALSQ